MRVLWLSHFLPFPATGHGALQRSHHLLLQTSKTYATGLVAFGGVRDSNGLDVVDEARDAMGPQLSFMDIVPRSPKVSSLKQLVSLATSTLGTKSYWEQWFADQRFRECVIRRLESFQPDVIHIDTVLLAAYFKYAGRIPLVVTHHNVESCLLKDRAHLAAWPFSTFWHAQSHKVAAMERRAAVLARTNILVSEDDEARFKSFFPGSATVVVSNGVDIDYFHPGNESAAKPKSMVFAGGMDWYPNRLAMEWFASTLWPALAASDPERRMTVVGKSPPVTVKNLAASDQRVSVLGFVDDVRPHVHSAATYLCPIHVGGGTRLKILDALAMSRPLVSTSLGVSGLGLQAGVHYLAAETADDFVRQVTWLENDVGLRHRLVEAGRSFVCANYSWPLLGSRFTAALALSASRPAMHDA